MEQSAQAKQSKEGELCRRILWLGALWVWQRCRAVPAPHSQQEHRATVTPSRALALRGRAEHLHLPTALPGATAALAGVPPPLPLPRH